MKDIKQVQSAVRHFPLHTKFRTFFKLVYVQWKQMKTIQLLLELHGHQILNNGIFNGDPHPGNILMLSNGKLGLIDYGQCKRLDVDQRLALRRVVSELSSPTVDNKAVQHLCITWDSDLRMAMRVSSVKLRDYFLIPIVE
jgi:hypothetical protein